MEAVAGITDRIQQIQSRIAQVSAPSAAPVGGGDRVLGFVGEASFVAALQEELAGGPGSSTGDAGGTGGMAYGGSADPDAPWVLDPARQMLPATAFAPAGTFTAAQLAQTLAARTAAGVAAMSGVGATAGAAGAGGAATGPAHATGGTSAVGAGRHAVNERGIPLELIQYGNGKIPAGALSQIENGNGHRLWTPAARSFEALRAAAARDGVTIGITDSYRSFEGQVDVARRKGLYSEGGLAARPGTSNHGWGLSLDLRLDGTAQSWMRANAKEFGFVEDVPREPWHWTYRPTH